MAMVVMILLNLLMIMWIGGLMNAQEILVTWTMMTSKSCQQLMTVICWQRDALFVTKITTQMARIILIIKHLAVVVVAVA